MNLVISTRVKRQIIDITDEITQNLKCQNGLVSVFIKHTTAAITTADLDPGTDKDFLDFLESLIPNINWRHPHDPKHAPDHLLSSIIGSSVCVPIDNDELQLGAWQRIILVELDGPKKRNVEITQIKENPG
jgi:secondary thiamine-phosphate synthase enzyme